MKRIRYKKANEYIVESEKMVGVEKIYSAAIDLVNVEGYIIIHTENTNQSIETLRAKNLNELKKLIKQNLKERGVLFEDEVRPGRNLKCQM